MKPLWQTSSWEELSEERRYHCDAELPENEEITLLSRLIFAEAAGESTLGKEAVGCVVRNRVEAPSKYQREFGSGYKGAITKPGAFAGVGSRLWNLVDNIESLRKEDCAALKECIETAGSIYYGGISDPTDGAQFFISGASLPTWLERAVERGRIIETVQIGGHRFFKYKD